MYQLVIANKNYSSWSLRPWLLMKVQGIDFEEININIYSDEGKEELKQYTNTAKVPILINDELTIWDSLAIVEYLAERHPEKSLWPQAPKQRAIARSIVSEMHSSFMEVRNQLPMNCRLKGKLDKIPQALQRDINRIALIWRDCRTHFGKQGNFLFGNFSIADAFYAPIALRFASYGIELNKIESDYIQHLLELPELQQWINAAKEEKIIVEQYEVLNDKN